MAEKIQFGSRASANAIRDRISEYLSPTDDRRSVTVTLKSSAPDSIVERVESESFGSQTQQRQSFGKATLSESEKETLRRTTSFDWQSHGFEAMSAKAALEAKGVDTWQDFYEPGEGVDSTLSKLQSSKAGAAESRAGLGIEGMRTDEGDMGNVGRRSTQAERAQSRRTKSAKRPAILEQDEDAIGFIREEQRFDDDVFDIQFSDPDELGMPQPTGRDAELVEERHEERSREAKIADESKKAPITRDPLKWASNPSEYDFPGVDTVQPEHTESNSKPYTGPLDPFDDSIFP